MDFTWSPTAWYDAGKLMQMDALPLKGSFSMVRNSEESKIINFHLLSHIQKENLSWHHRQLWRPISSCRRHVKSTSIWQKGFIIHLPFLKNCSVIVMSCKIQTATRFLILDDWIIQYFFNKLVSSFNNGVTRQWSYV